jgi:hypothetical protein
VTFLLRGNVNNPYHFFELDLSGADGWTVAAYADMFGDRGMLLHYENNIKPYIAIALKLLGKPVNFHDLDSLKAAVKETKIPDNDKFIAKRVQHGGAYLEGGLTISRNILKDSEGKLLVSTKECDALKNWYLHEMYPGIPRWQAWVTRRIRERSTLIAASGQVRQFFGRPEEIVTKAVAFEPQANTSYVINKGILRMWKDPENYKDPDEIHRILTTRPTTSILHAEPLHQIHDAVAGQFFQSITEWAIAHLRVWFCNPLTIAGQKITIPFEGGYGPDWGACKDETRRLGVI